MSKTTCDCCRGDGKHWDELCPTLRERTEPPNRSNPGIFDLDGDVFSDEEVTAACFPCRGDGVVSS